MRRVMALFSKPIKTLDDLFVHTLEDMYDAEHAIAKSLPKMAQKAGQAELRQAFEKHLNATRNQIARLEQIFKMHGVIEEAEELISDVDDAEVLGAGLISSAQAVERYEITRYGTPAAFARRLGRDDCTRILAETLAEETATAERLTE